MIAASPLENEHRALGAVFTDFAGHRLPLRYTSDLAEHAATRTACGIFDISHMAEIFVSGPRVALELSGALTGDFLNMPCGRAKYTLILNETGGIEDDLIVYKIDNECYMVVANAANRHKVVTLLQNRLTASIVDDRTESISLLALQGPDSADLIKEVFCGAETLSRFGHGSYVCDSASALYAQHEVSRKSELDSFDPQRTICQAESNSNKSTSAYNTELSAQENIVVLSHEEPHPNIFTQDRAIVARTGYTGEDGFEIFLPNNKVTAIWRIFISRGATPCGLSARNSLRIEAGMPLYGHELRADITPHQAGLERFVSPPCIGYQRDTHSPLPASLLTNSLVVPSPNTAPPTAPVLVGLLVEGRRAAREGYTVCNKAHEPIGVITSGIFSPTLQRSIAMAYILPEYRTEELLVDIRGTATSCRITPMPFYKRNTPNHKSGNSHAP